MCYFWPKIWGRRDYYGSDISCMSLSNPFPSISFCRNWTTDYLGGLRKLLNISILVPKVKEFPPLAITY